MSYLRLTSVIAVIAVSMAGCGPPPGFENQWRSMMDARDRYEMCTAQRVRPVSACKADLTAYRAERARYNAEMLSNQAIIGR
jgi:hypothetical protein